MNFRKWGRLLTQLGVNTLRYSIHPTSANDDDAAEHEYGKFPTRKFSATITNESVTAI